jgi:hypothetical protein
MRLMTLAACLPALFLSPPGTAAAGNKPPQAPAPPQAPPVREPDGGTGLPTPFPSARPVPEATSKGVVAPAPARKASRRAGHSYAEAYDWACRTGIPLAVWVGQPPRSWPYDEWNTSESAAGVNGFPDLAGVSLLQAPYRGADHLLEERWFTGTPSRSQITDAVRGLPELRTRRDRVRGRGETLASQAPAPSAPDVTGEVASGAGGAGVEEHNGQVSAPAPSLTDPNCCLPAAGTCPPGTAWPSFPAYVPPLPYRGGFNGPFVAGPLPATGGGPRRVGGTFFRGGGGGRLFRGGGGGCGPSG